MNKLKAGLATIAGLTVSVVTLRALRQRRTTPREEAGTAAEAALEEAGAAADHTAAAVEHARTAGEKTVEYVGEELEPLPGSVASAEEDATLPESGQRLRRVGKGWIRRS